MAIYLNTNKSLINFKSLCVEKYLVDKSTPILAVAICYASKDKEHKCKIEEI